MLRLVAIAALVACDGPPNIGHTCGVTSPSCDESLTCNSTILGGYCTVTCVSPGSTEQCPEGSICDTIAGGTMCLKLCDTTADCERGDLQCNGVTSSNLKACKP